MKTPTSTRNTIIFIYILLLFFLILIGGYFFLNSPRATNKTEILVNIERGSSVSEITTILEQRNVIRSRLFAYYYTRIKNLSLKAGMYKVSAGMKTSNILQTIASGKQEYIRVLIPEGLSLSKTATYLQEAGVTSAIEFINAAKNTSVLSEYGLPGKSAVGFLFPDTYFFSYNMPPEDIVKVMIDNFFKKIQKIDNVPINSTALFEKVILASIIEREYRVTKEAPLISSVFVNRLQIGMGLQSCATIEYILTEIQQKPHPSKLTLDDLSIPSDYNTYLWAGLPPGPISNPGFIALSAAFTPADTHYLYFRLTDSEEGSHSFSYSLDEHVQAGRQLIPKKAAGK